MRKTIEIGSKAQGPAAAARVAPPSDRAQGMVAFGVFAGAVGLDVVLWYAAVAWSLVLPVALALHVLLILATAKAMALVGVGDRTLQGLGLPCLLLTGPIGGIGALLVVPLASLLGAHSEMLEAWYQRLSAPTETDQTTLLYQKLATGRAVRPGAFPVPHFAKVLQTGSLRDQQSVLGLIGLKYEPEYRTALHLGLTSSEPSIRVQAAAVFAKLREHYKVDLKRGLAKAGNSSLERSQKRELARELVKILESGFLDKTETRRALACAQSLVGELSSSQVGDFDTELLACRLLAVEDKHEAICHRLEPRLASAPPPLRALYAKSMRILGRHLEREALRNAHTPRRATVTKARWQA